MEYGLIGEHLPHSFSKIIHEKIADYTYDLHELRPDEVEAFMRAGDFKGINVTIPYKQTVIPFLDEISDQARQIGAVNTVVNRGGKLYGFNTDYFGMRDLIKHNGVLPTGKKVLILGTGGTSKTAIAVATDLGASEILRVSRTEGHGDITYEEAYRDHTDAEFVINCTPCGMFPKVDEAPLDISRFPKVCGVVDAIYNPLRDKLILDAKKLGLPAEGGLYMLVVQAVYACEMFIDTKIDSAVSDKVFMEILNSKRNIVLAGADAAAKRAAADALAAKLDRKIVDADDQTIKDYILENGLIIAAADGTTSKEENVDALKKNGFIIAMDGTVSDQACDGRIPEGTSAEEAAEQILAIMNSK